METILIELNTPKARKLIEDLVELGIISIKSTQPDWLDLWNKLDSELPQTEPDITEAEILAEIKAYRSEKHSGSFK